MRAAVSVVPVLAIVVAAHAASFDRLTADHNRFDPSTVERTLPSAVMPSSHVREFEAPTTRAPLAFSDHPTFAATHRPDLPLLAPAPAAPSSGSGFAIGPIRAEMIAKTSPRTGRVSYKPHYSLNGVTLFGGAIGGSLDTRGGMVTLQWKTAP
jgi:hypothetical protein